MGKSPFNYGFPKKNSINDQNNGKTVRVPFSIEQSMIEYMDYFVHESGMFTSRSDFVFSALRAYYIDYLPKATKVLSNYSEKYPKHPARALDEFKKYAEKYCNDTIELNKEQLPMPKTKKIQISVSVPVTMIGMIDDMSEMSEGNDSKIVIAAIFHYISVCMLQSESVSSFIDKYNELYIDAYGPME